jgi:hypothetical protein
MTAGRTRDSWGEQLQGQVLLCVRDASAMRLHHIAVSHTLCSLQPPVPFSGSSPPRCQCCAVGRESGCRAGKSCFCASLCSSLLLTPAAAVFCKAADRSTGNAMT